MLISEEHSEIKGSRTIMILLLAALMITSGGIKIVPHFVTNCFSSCLIFFMLCLRADKVARSEVVRKLIVIYLITVCLILINFALNHDNVSPTEYLFFIWYILLAIMARLVLSPKDICFAFDSIMKVIVIGALVSFPIQLAAGSHLLSYSNGRDLDYLYLIPGIFYVKASVHVLGLDLHRVCLLFWEPGVLQAYLNIYLLRLIGERRKNAIVATCVAICLTFSTTGIILMAMILVYTYRTLLHRLRILQIGVLLAALIASIAVLLPVVMNKFTGTEVSSMLVRYYDTEMSIENMRVSPIKGIGLQDVVTYSKNRSTMVFQNYIGLPVSEEFRSQILDRKNGGTTNSFLRFMEAFGVLGLAALAYLLSRGSVWNVSRGLFALVFILSVSSEPVLTTPFFLSLLVERIPLLQRRTSYKKAHATSKAIIASCER